MKKLPLPNAALLPSSSNCWQGLVNQLAAGVQQGQAAEALCQDAVDGVLRQLRGDQVLLYRAGGTATLRPLTAAPNSVNLESLPALTDPGYDYWLGLQDGAYLVVTDTANPTPETASFCQAFAHSSVLAVPVFLRRHYWGLLLAQRSSTRYPWQRNEIDGLRSVALQLGVVLSLSSDAPGTAADSVAHNRALMEAIPDLLIHMDSHGKHLDFLSGSGVRIVNEEDSRAPGSSVWDVLPAELAKERLMHVRRALTTGEVQIYEQQLRVAGELCHEEVRVIPYRDQEVLLVVRDISALKNSQMALEEANQQLQARIEDLHQRHLEMRLLGEMGDFLQACTQVQEAYQALPSLLDPLLPVAQGVVFIMDDARSRLHPVACWGHQPHQPAAFDPGECWALRRGRVHQVTPQQTGLRCPHIGESAATVLCIPMMAQGEDLGLCFLSAAELSPSTQQLAHTVAEQVALAIANLQLRQRLFQQSIRDPLTGLYNRRYLEESLAQELSRAERYGHSVAVIMLDIDYFKHVNDNYGHDAGDQVLRAVGRLLRERVRASDFACRYGGEELTLVLPNSSGMDALHRAETIREAIGDLQIRYEGRSLPTISASLGVASYPQHGKSGYALIQTADTALYRAKAAGRNRVIMAE